MQTDFIELPPLVPGQTLGLIKHTFGDDTALRSVYLQAGLHADEHPGLLVLQHLIVLLNESEQQGRLQGKVVIVPFANPVGMAQNILGCWTGRFNLSNGENFNRNFPDICHYLDNFQDSNSSAGLITSPREKVNKILSQLSMPDAVSAMKLALLTEALQHDSVLDLHCDTAGILHLYANACHTEHSRRLAAAMGAEVVFVEEHAGGQPFDESLLRCWQWFAKRGELTPEQLPFSVTVELRGQADVSDDLAYRDALGLMRYLEEEGVIIANHPASLATDSVTIYPLEGASHLSAPADGIVVWRKKTGERVMRNECLGEIVSLTSVGIQGRTPVFSDVDGIIVVQPLMKFIRKGQRVALLAGTEKRSDRRAGSLLNHF